MRKNFKRIALVLLGLLVLLAIFHRPILFRLTRYFIAQAAQQQHLSLSYDMDGSIFTNLRIKNLQASPTESGPVERLEIGSLRLRYSLWGLLRKGLPGFLESVAVADAQIVIDPSKSLPPAKEQKKQPFKFPALIPEKLSIQNLNFTSRQQGKDLLIEKFNLLLDPQRTGSVEAQTIQIPQFQTWTDFHAQASYRDRDLVLENFDLGPQLQFTRLSLDMSRLSDDVLAFSVAGQFFGGSTTLSGKITDLNGTNVLTLDAESAGNSLAAASEYFGLTSPLAGTIANLNLKLSGEAARPVTWSGSASLRVDDFVVRKQVALDEAKVQTQLADGQAVVRSFDLTQVANHVTGSATVQLPEMFSGFAKLDANGTLDADLQNLATISDGAATGAATIGGRFALNDGQPSTDLRLQSEHATYGKNEVNDADLRLRLGQNATE